MSEPASEIIDYEAFARVDLRVGTVIAVEPNAKARTPAYVLTIDFGPSGRRTSSAQITDLYAAEALVGRQVVCVCNFEPKRIAGIKSEVLVLGASDAEGRVVLAGFDHPVPDGAKLH